MNNQQDIKILAYHYIEFLDMKVVHIGGENTGRYIRMKMKCNIATLGYLS